MTKPHRKPQIGSKGTKGRPARRNAPISQPDVPDGALNALSVARQTVYEIVAELPFADPLARLPEEGDEGDAYIDLCRKWYARCAEACSSAFVLAQAPLNSSECGPGLQCVMASDLIGDAPLVPGVGPLEFEVLLTSEIDAEAYAQQWRRCRQRDGYRAGFTAPFRARQIVFELRLFAFELLEWLDRAIVRLATALLPRITVVKANRKESWTVNVSLAGVPQTTKTIGKTRFRQLWRLNNGATVTFRNRTDYTRDMPFLDKLLIDADPDRKLRRKLIDTMVGKIKFT